MKIKSANITRYDHLVSHDERINRNGHLPGVLWFTGLPGAGKSTLTKELESRLTDDGYYVTVVDNELIRRGVSSDLGYSHEDRTENIRRAGEVSALLARAGCLVLAGFISPYHSDRDEARKATGLGFHEVFLDADADVCEKRDINQLYEKARAGQIDDFTGVSAPYEKPLSPDLVLDTEALSVEDSIDQLVVYVGQNFKL